VDSKVCTKCGEEKLLSQFWKTNKNKSGLMPRCGSCEAEYNLEYRLKNLEKVSVWKRQEYLKNKEWYREHSKKYREDPLNSVAIKECSKLWRKNNMDKRRSNQAKRRAVKLNACPQWLSSCQKEEIKLVYAHARILGEDYQVDHIIPLQGENVCGLHVPWNLQILPAKVNASKGNKFCSIGTGSVPTPGTSGFSANTGQS
jgi:hypothetical protein